ncbi:MAG TPA: PIG-L family deacetylase [Gemmatimonadaceae bacterium]|nr:PIG-L family deacetylase [Gemmatimonadaceae bacterium]
MRSHTLSALAASAILSTISPLSPVAAQDRPRTLVALLAHADDEGAAAPVLARYAREGVEVYLIVASDGSAGTGSKGGYLVRADSGPEGGALTRVRAEEARCAAAAIGAQEPILLGFPDGKLGDYTGDRSLMYRLTERVAKEIERLRPDVVITWGPDGGTGHPDHRLIGNIATQLQRAGAPGMPERLFHMYLPVEAFRLLNPQRGEPPLLLPQTKYFTVRVAFTPADLDAAQRGMTCHRTQFTPEVLQRMLPAQGRVWNGKVAFIPAFAATNGEDLFR